MKKLASFTEEAEEACFCLFFRARRIREHSHVRRRSDERAAVRAVPLWKSQFLGFSSERNSREKKQTDAEDPVPAAASVAASPASRGERPTELVVLVEPLGDNSF